MPPLHFARIAAILGFIALASPASAEDPNALIEHGVALREQGRDEEALAEFRKAYALAPTPRAQAQMGLAEQALGLWLAAEEHVRDALKSDADPWIQKNRAALEQSLRTIAQHLGTLEVRGMPGAVLFVDGARVGQLPLERGLRIEVGHRALEVRAQGFQSTSRTIIVSPGETARETIELRPNVAQEEPAKPGREPRPHDGVHSSNGSTQRTLGWVLTGVGGAAFVTGVIGLIARSSAVSAYNDDPSCPGIDNPGPRPSQCQSHVDSEGTWKAIAIAGLAGGVALGAGGLALVLTAPPGAGSHGTAGISLTGRF
ncbi:hypothetical protein LZC95_05640 [Pendulispora brunnea]|uniref:PEGA domain-containing protein n=1 Tax=Pendulispora brunnea TaxID=2905690 RepID=A0ABZ2KE39_9BACT